MKGRRGAAIKGPGGEGGAAEGATVMSCSLQNMRVI